MTEHIVTVAPMRKTSDPDTYDLRCTCGWKAEVHGIRNARDVAQGHADRRTS